jgi:hypothetical protein
MSLVDGMPLDFDATADNRSAQVIQVETLGRGGIVVLLATVIVALLVAAMSYGLAGRAMDRASIAEREARIAQDKYTYVQSELAKRGIHISTDGH